MGHKATFSEMIMAGKQVDMGIKLGRIHLPPMAYQQLITSRKITLVAPASNFNPVTQNQNLHYEYHQGAPDHTTDNCWKLREKIQDMIEKNEISFNAVKPPTVQANPLPDHGSSSGPTVNMIGAYFLGKK
ncbi:hypothetical protein CRG98_037755 [Punica granatum]|uniref:Uncharacterized protein n=1 Tax=Punica granatum TaxID=22663 RepID=A0A2I0IDW4_PUNGR|nr:hypothetical protein CRG98_037755 [Punica granatum]